MRNPYFENLTKIEFVLTYACTGKCKHCSEGEHSLCGECIDPQIAADSVRRIAAEYDIKTVMVFGGEPMLYPNVLCAIISTASELGIPKRQVITNGYFSKSRAKIKDAVRRLKNSGVNDLLLSVDAFHQETIPLDIVKFFATEAKTCGIPIRLSPAWLVSREDNNQYNEKTRQILKSFEDEGIFAGDGNVIFPEGNALKYLSEYFSDNPPTNPYTEDPCNVKCISFEPNGDILGGNVYRNDIIEIIENYTPQAICG